MGQCWRDFICKFKFYPVLILTLKLTPLDGSQVQLCFTQLHGCRLYLWLKLCSLSINSALLFWSLFGSQWKLDPQGCPLSFLMSLLWTLPTAPGGLLPSSPASNTSPGRLAFKAPVDCGTIRFTGIGVFSRLVRSIPFSGFFQECQRATRQELSCHAAFLQLT